MDLLQPSSGLLIWTILCILSLVLFIVALISLLSNQQMHRTTKLKWGNNYHFCSSNWFHFIFHNRKIRKEYEQYKLELVFIKAQFFFKYLFTNIIPSGFLPSLFSITILMPAFQA